MTEIYQILRLGSELHLHLGKRRVCRIYSLEGQFVQRQAKSIFQGAPLRYALGLRQSGVESCHAYPALSDTTPARNAWRCRTYWATVCRPAMRAWSDHGPGLSPT